jgi:hypothetical protein
MKKTGSFTGDVYNMDVFQILLQYEVSRSSRYPNPLALIQIEMTPTAFSPEALSAAPLIFSAALATHLRSADIPARAGNLFSILLPNSNKHGAQAVCERLLSVFKSKFEDTAGNSITFSLHMGGTTHPGGDTITSKSLFQKAEEGLMQSRRKGANTYVFVE